MIQRAFHILKLDPKMSKISEKNMFVTRQGKNLQQYLTSTKLRDTNENREPVQL